MQRNWIGRSEGARVTFPLLRQAPARGPKPGGPPESRSSRRGSTRSTGRRSCCSRPSTTWWIGSPPSATTRRRSANRSHRFRALRSRGPADGRHREGGILHRSQGREPVHRRRGADLGRELRARRVRHRRRHGSARPRPARLRVRQEVRVARSNRDSARRATPPRRHDDRSVDRWVRSWIPANSGRVDRRDAPRWSDAAEESGIGRAKCSTVLRTGAYRASGTGERRFRSSTASGTASCRSRMSSLPVVLPAGREFTGRGDSPLAQVPSS